MLALVVNSSTTFLDHFFPVVSTRGKKQLFKRRKFKKIRFLLLKYIPCHFGVSLCFLIMI